MLIAGEEKRQKRRARAALKPRSYTQINLIEVGGSISCYLEHATHM